MREDALQVRRELAGGVLAEAGDGAGRRGASRRSSPSAPTRVRRLDGFLRSLAREGDPDLAGLTLAVRQLRSLADPG